MKRSTEIDVDISKRLRITEDRKSFRSIVENISAKSGSKLADALRLSYGNFLELVSLSCPEASSSDLKEYCVEVMDILSSDEAESTKMKLIRAVSSQLAEGDTFERLSAAFLDIASQLKIASRDNGNYSDTGIAITFDEQDQAPSPPEITFEQKSDPSNSKDDITDPIIEAITAALPNILQNDLNQLYTSVQSILVMGNSIAIENALMELFDFSEGDLVKTIIHLNQIGKLETDIDSEKSEVQPPNGLLDLEELMAEQTRRAEAVVTFQAHERKVFEAKRPGYDEIVVEPVKKRVPASGELVDITALPSWAFPAFEGISRLNPVQSIVYPVVFAQFTENVLMCAPTGAGKTNVAMLGILNVVSQFVDSQGVIDSSAFKVVYIAPMKALVNEVVQSFKLRLKGLGLTVNELSGDVSLTRKQLAETNLLVTTPEKYDVITRKNSRSLSTVRLIIIDEIHLLHDSRGPVLEAIVARTFRRIERTRDYTRVIGLSATLPNYEDVALFLRVNRNKGLFHFGPEYRPVPLKQTYVGITTEKVTKRNSILSEVVFEKVLEDIGKNQVIVFVHSRKDAMRTARELRDMSISKGHITKFLPKDSASLEILKDESTKLKSPELRDLLQYAIGFHHAGLPKSDREMVEELFSDRHLQVIVSTLTLAWGVNLPAHTVIIKGTQVYKPEISGWAELSAMDMMQMIGRAGRPQYDTEGHGIIITKKSELSYYLSMNNTQLPVESQLISKIPEFLNAEISSGTIFSRNDGVAWLGYTYFNVRMLRSPKQYGLNTDVPDMTQIVQFRVNLIHSALVKLASLGMIKYDSRSGSVSPLNTGIVASAYYIRTDSVSSINHLSKPTMTDAELLELFSSASEFKHIIVREEERLELSKLAEVVPFPCRASLDSNPSQLKISVLLQSYISKLDLEGFALSSDMVFIQQNGSRIMRAIFEVAVRKGWACLANRALTWAKSIENRMWSVQCPLRQSQSQLPLEAIARLEKKLVPWSELCAMEPTSLGELVKGPKLGKLLHRVVHQIPRIVPIAYIQPISRTCVNVEITVSADFAFETTSPEPFWVFIEDIAQQKLFVSERFYVSPDLKEINLKFVVPVTDPLPPHYFLRFASDRLCAPDSVTALSLRPLIFPSKTPRPLETHTEFVSLESIREFDVKSLRSGGLSIISTTQHIIIPRLLAGESLLISAPEASGKFTSALAVIISNIRQKKKTVIICPSIDLVLRRYEQFIVFNGSSLSARIAFKHLASEVQNEEKLVLFYTAENLEKSLRRPADLQALLTVSTIVADQTETLDSRILPSVAYEVVLSRIRHFFATSGANCQLVVNFGSTSNSTDFARFLGIPDQGILRFSSESRLVPLDISVQAVDTSHSLDSSIDFSKAVNHILSSHTTASVIVFVPDEIVADSIMMDLLNSGRFGMKEIASLTLLTSTVEMDNIQRLFKSEQLKLLIITRPFIWKIHVRAACTLIVEIPTSTSSENDSGLYENAEIMRMVALSGRMGVDSIGICGIITIRARREYVFRLITESFPIESNLDSEAIKRLCNEIAISNCKNKQDAVDWLTWSYFYRRLSSNPNYYALKDASMDTISNYLSDLVESSADSLENHSLCSSDGITLTLTSSGSLFSQQNCDWQSFIGFRHDAVGSIRRKGLLTMLSRTDELGRSFLPYRTIERQVVKSMQDAGFSLTINPGIEEIAFAFLVSRLKRVQLEPFLEPIRTAIVQKAISLCHCFIDILGLRGHLKAALAGMGLCASLCTGVDIGANNLLQVPGFTEAIAAFALEKYNIDDILDFGALPDLDRNSILDLIEGASLASIAEFCNSYPSLQLSIEVLNRNSESISLKVMVDRETETNPEIEEMWWLLIGAGDSVLFMQRVSFDHMQTEIAVSISYALYDAITIYVISGTFVGVDQEETISFKT